MDEAPPACVPEPAVAIERAEAPSPIVLVCDHASNHLPGRYGSLGLTRGRPAQAFRVGPGRAGGQPPPLRIAGCAAGLWLRFPSCARRQPPSLGRRFDRRNRRRRPRARQFAAFRPASASVASPKSTRPTTQRSRICWRKGRSGVDAARWSRFTPTRHVCSGVVRPWHCGVIFASDSRLGEALVKGLREEDGLVVGVNEPYAPSDRVYHTMARHGEANGNPAVMIEVRNDLVCGRRRPGSLGDAPCAPAAIGGANESRCRGRGTA